MISLTLPDFNEDDAQAAARAVRSSTWNEGRAVEQFEKSIAARASRPFGVAVNSAGMGLILCLKGMGVRPGDEVIVPALGFVSGLNAVLEVGAKPVFVDCDPRTLNLRADVTERRITERTRAVIGASVYGNPAGLYELALLCNKHEIPLIEDASDGFGGRQGREPVGRFGRAAVFSFSEGMPVSAGEGCVIVTHDDSLARMCISMRDQGREPLTKSESLRGESAMGRRLRFERHGYSARMSEIHAAIGLSQLHRLEELAERRQHLASAYVRRLIGHPDLIVPTVPNDSTLVWTRMAVRLNDRYSGLERDMLVEGMRRHEIGVSEGYPALPALPWCRRLLGHALGDFPVAESVSQRTMLLPFHTQLSESDVDLVCQTLILMLQRQTFSRELG